MKENTENTYTKISTKTGNLKKWINSIECVKTTTNITYENLNKTKIFYENFYIENIFEQINYLTKNIKIKIPEIPIKIDYLNLKETGKKYFITINDSSKIKLDYVKEILLNYLSLNVKRINSTINYLKLNEGKPLISINHDDVNYFSLEINKKFLPENFSIFADFVKKFLRFVIFVLSKFII